MNPQDHVDLLLCSIAHIVRDLGRTDCGFAVIGAGECLEEARAQSARLGLEAWVHLPGWLPQDKVFSYLASADLGLDTSLQNEISPHKVIEYMASGLPFVAFDVRETRVLGEGASALVPPADIESYAEQVVALLDDVARRSEMGEIGRQRVRADLSWERQSIEYIDIISRLSQRTLSAPGSGRRAISSRRLRTRTLSSYSDRHLGMLGRARELFTLWQSQRQDVPGQAREMLAQLESGQSEMERALGGKLQDKDVLIIGPGQQLVEMSFFARHNRVTGIDLDVIPQHPSVREYLKMFRKNGYIRTLKTMGRKAMGYDRALRREVERQGLAVDDDPTIVAMDAAAMTFPDGSFDCVFSHSCFEHLSEPGDVIRQVARVLRPGGLAHVDVHLYTSDSGCHDVRIFGGRREFIPAWSHLRPQYRHLVQPNSYLNEIRLSQWRDLFSPHWPGVMFRLRPERDPAIRSALAPLRSDGQLEEYEDEELLSDYLFVDWVKPASRSLPPIRYS